MGSVICFAIAFKNIGVAAGQLNLTVVPDPDPVTPGEVKSCGLLKVKDLTGVAGKMWAYLTIREMLQQRVGEDDPRVKQQLKDKATQLALRVRGTSCA